MSTIMVWNKIKMSCKKDNKTKGKNKKNLHAAGSNFIGVLPASKVRKDEKEIQTEAGLDEEVINKMGDF